MSLLREVKKKSALPVYGVAATWLLYCLIFPMYKLWHFGVAICCSIAVYILLSYIFPGKTEHIEELPEPETTGNAEIDALLAEGRVAISEMQRLKISIKNESVRLKIDELIGVTDKIFNNLLYDADDYRQVKRFADYFLPTTIKLLNAYDRMDSLGSTGENIAGTLERIDSILNQTITAYNKQLDSLFGNQALDIETDIAVLEGMIRKEGLSEKEF